MISLGFSSPFEKEQIEKLSVIYEADSFVYGLIGSNNVLLECGSKAYQDLQNLIQSYKSDKVSIHTLSKTRYFTHLPLENLGGKLENLKYRDKLGAEGVICCYDHEPGYEYCDHLKHFSTAIHHHYLFNAHPVCHLHFGNSSLTVCICGKGGFKFYNEYEIETAEDAVYYAQAMARNFSTGTERFHYYLSGHIVESSNLYKLMFRYLDPIEMIDVSEFSTKQHEIGHHAYFDHYLNTQL